MSKKVNKPKQNTLKQEHRPEKDLSQPIMTGQKLKSFFSDGRFRKISGLFFILVSIYLFLAFTSYLFNWKSEDSIFSNRLFDWGLLFDSSLEVDNLMGRFGAITAHLFIKKWFGIASYCFVFISFVLGIRLLFRKVLFPLMKAFKRSLFILIWVSVALGFLFSMDELQMLGGTFGYSVNTWINGVLGKIGTGLVLLFSLGAFLIYVFNLNLQSLLGILATEPEEGSDEEKPGVVDANEEGLGDIEEQDEQDSEDGEGLEDDEGSGDYNEIAAHTEADIISAIRNKIQQGGQPEFEFEVKNPVTPILPVNPVGGALELEVEVGNGSISGNNYQPIVDPRLEKVDALAVTEMGDYDPTLDLASFILPGVDLLDEYGNNTISVNKEELEANKNKIVDTLNNYSIQIDKIKATIGPTVTLYEIIPAAGVRIAKIKNLEDDIALSLAALGIRIIAPIPGKGTIGIEVPNRKPEIVSMKSILSSEKYQSSPFDLPIALGKTIANEVFITDLTKMPHLLMAGATGQGKSVGLNAILASILYKKHPAFVKFVLVDPKKVELSLYAKIERHYLAKLPDSEEAIITDTRKVVRTLNSLCVEMDNRYDLLKDAQVRNIKEYNAKFISRRLNPNEGHHFMPFIVLIVDEFADLIMTAGKEVELPIARLAQLARAVGIHLIIATQRPSVNIITGTIKANFPARIAFRVTSKIDSRTILDSGGAEQLIGRGDMLLSTGSDLIRLQCAFIDTPELEKVTEFIGTQRAYPDAFLLPEYLDEDGGGEVDDFDPTDRDDLFEDAARIIVATQQGSTSLLQRKLKLGYNRAGRLIDQLEAAGIVGPFEGSKAREVKIKDEVTLEQYLKSLS